MPHDFPRPVPARDRERILERLDELRDLDRLMRQPGTLAGPGSSRDDDTIERDHP